MQTEASPGDDILYVLEQQRIWYKYKAIFAKGTERETCPANDHVVFCKGEMAATCARVCLFRAYLSRKQNVLKRGTREGPHEWGLVYGIIHPY